MSVGIRWILTPAGYHAGIPTPALRRDVAHRDRELLPFVGEYEIDERARGRGVLRGLENGDGLGHRGQSLCGKDEIDGRALGLGVERHEVDQHAVRLLAVRDGRQHCAVAAHRDGVRRLELLEVAPAEVRAARHRSEHDRRRSGIERARHRDLTLVFRLREIGPRRGTGLRRGVDGDARGDELGAEVRALGVIGSGIEPVDLRFAIRQQPSVFLERLHARGIGEQQDVGLGRAGGKLRGELPHDFGRPGTKDVDLDTRLRTLECGDGLGCIALGLRRIEDELAGRRLRRRGARRHCSHAKCGEDHPATKRDAHAILLHGGVGCRDGTRDSGRVDVGAARRPGGGAYQAGGRKCLGRGGTPSRKRPPARRRAKTGRIRPGADGGTSAMRDRAGRAGVGPAAAARRAGRHRTNRSCGDRRGAGPRGGDPRFACRRLRVDHRSFARCVRAGDSVLFAGNSNAAC